MGIPNHMHLIQYQHPQLINRLLLQHIINQRIRLTSVTVRRGEGRYAFYGTDGNVPDIDCSGSAVEACDFDVCVLEDVAEMSCFFGDDGYEWEDNDTFLLFEY